VWFGDIFPDYRPAFKEKYFIPLEHLHHWHNWEQVITSIKIVEIVFDGLRTEQVD